MLRPDGEAESLRTGLLLLVALGVAGTALALAYDRHWQSPWQLVPWITLGAVSVAWVALVARRTAATVWLARAVAVLTIVVATLGVWRHVDANYNADHAVHHHAAVPPGSAEEKEPSRGGHHHDDEDAAGDDHHHDDEMPESAVAESEAPETTSGDVRLVDAMTGSAGHAPVPSALAIVPVGLALALATIGLGGARGQSGA